MTLRLLAASFATAAVLGLTTAAHAQAPEQEKSPAPNDAPATTTAPAESDADSASTGKAEAPKKKGPSIERATFGGGCFWCMEAVFERIKGVKDVVSGYAGGNVPNPTYEMVHSGLTGHAEVIQIVFDPKELPYEKLLSVFWSAHDPTTLNAQGDDFGPQYRSVIFFHSEAQRKAALASYEDLTRRRAFRAPIVTQLVPINNFYPAEPEHQNYYRNNRGSYYSQFYIDSKLKKLHLNTPTAKKKR